AAGRPQAVAAEAGFIPARGGTRGSPAMAILARSDGRSEAQTDQYAPRQAPRPAPARGAARQPLPQLPPAHAAPSRLPRLPGGPRPGRRAAADRGAVAVAYPPHTLLASRVPSTEQRQARSDGSVARGNLRAGPGSAERAAGCR